MATDRLLGAAGEEEVLQWTTEVAARLWFSGVERGLREGVVHGSIGCLRNTLDSLELADKFRQKKLELLNEERQTRWGGV